MIYQAADSAHVAYISEKDIAHVGGKDISIPKFLTYTQATCTERGGVSQTGDAGSFSRITLPHAHQCGVPARTWAPQTSGPRIRKHSTNGGQSNKVRAQGEKYTVFEPRQNGVPKAQRRRRILSDPFENRHVDLSFVVHLVIHDR